MADLDLEPGPPGGLAAAGRTSKMDAERVGKYMIRPLLGHGPVLRPRQVLRSDLCFLTMVGWDHQGDNAPASRRCRKANPYRDDRHGIQRERPPRERVRKPVEDIAWFNEFRG